MDDKCSDCSSRTHESEKDFLWWPEPSVDSFEAACQTAVQQQRALHIHEGSHVSVAQTVEVKKNGQVLKIVGFGNSVVEGSSLCLFSIGGRNTRLELENVSLRHVPPENSGDSFETGGAIFLMGSAVAKLTNVSLSTKCGLGVWMVQKSQLSAAGCCLHDCGRSGLALFGNASALLESCTLERCAIHGACARGRTKLTLHACQVLDCGRRGVYGYQNNTLQLDDCSVSGTQDPSRAAVEAAGAKEGDSVCARIGRCRVHSNLGVGVRLRGAVKHVVEHNDCFGNCRGDLDIVLVEAINAYPQSMTEPNACEAAAQLVAAAPANGTSSQDAGMRCEGTAVI